MDDQPDKLIMDEEDRYSRFQLIPWWDQDLLKKSKVLVVGAGALGNEILKNLALVGVGNIIVTDMDVIENSNLSRSVMFRASDEGRKKAEAAASMIKEINPDCRVQWLNVDVIHDLGLGVYRWADLVIGGLDNREARLSINQSCWKVGTPWIDGGIEVFFGIARVFSPPDSACYECTMDETDYKLINMRRSCGLLSREDMVEGKVPTTPTISSIIAGVQVQEALKLLHNREDIPNLVGKGLFFNGLNFDSYVVSYDKKEECLSHDFYDDIKELPLSVETTSLGQLIKSVSDEVGNDATIELEKELVYRLVCENCNTEENIFKTLGKVTEDEARCPVCGVIRELDMTHFIYGKEEYLDLKLSQVGIPGMEIITIRNGKQKFHIELTGDRKTVLGDVICE